MDDDERGHPATTQLMKGSGDEFLTRPALALDEDADPGVGHPDERLVQLDHGHRGADQPGAFGLGGLGLPSDMALAEFPDLQDAADGRPDGVRRERLADVVPGPQAEGLHRRLQGPIGRHENDRQVRPPLADRP